MTNNKNNNQYHKIKINLLIMNNSKIKINLLNKNNKKCYKILQIINNMLKINNNNSNST